MHKNLIACFILALISFNSTQAQVDPKEYLNALEILEKASGYYVDEKYDKAFVTFQQVNPNDTAYFYSRSLALECLYPEKRYDSVITVCEEVLALDKFNPRKEGFMNSKGHALIQKDRFEEANEFLTMALEEFPESYLLRYNLAVTYYELDDASRAIEELQTSLRYNPRYAATHIKLGLICAEGGHLTKAALCLNMGAFLAAAEDKSVTYLALLESLYEGSLYDEEIKVKFKEEEEFDELDLMIKNKVAENSKYKVKVKLPYGFIKYNHLIFEKIDYRAGDNGFWNQNYIGFFKEIFNAKQFANFSYFQCLSVEDQKTQSVILKNKKKVTAFIKWASPLFTEKMNGRTVRENGKYIENTLVHTGTYGFSEDRTTSGDRPTGTYTLFDDRGLITRQGQFSSSGNVDGVWKYFEDGVLTTHVTFSDGVPKGTRTSFYLNGSKSSAYDLKNDKIDGDVKQYYSFNQLYSKVPYNSEEKKDGVAEYYHENGAVSHKIAYADGELNGDYLEYFSNDQLKSKYKYVAGKIEGEFKTWHRNGKPRIEGQYEKGDPVGHWKYFHDNGQLEEEGDFKGGNRVGVWQNFSPNGKLSEETNYGETGKKTGVYKEYSYEGNLILELTYKEVEIISYKTYNAKGEVVNQGEKKKKELEFIDTHENGKMRIKGSYAKGKKVGTWFTYNQHEIIRSKSHYNDEGERDGDSKWYFENGSLETVERYKDGVLDGYYEDYYRDGSLYKHGWYKDGEKVGEWQYFYRDGKVKSTEYYLEGELVGDVKFFDEKGRLDEISNYFYGVFQGVTTFDSTGAIIESYPIVDGKCDAKYKDVNGKIKLDKKYVGAMSHGPSKSYHANGQLAAEGMRFDGRMDGDWKWYNRDGKLSSEGTYDYGAKEGEWKWYHDNGQLSDKQTFVDGDLEGTAYKYYENGKVETEKNYRNDKRHGESIYYDESGEIQLIRFYDDGYMLGYSYIGKDGKRVPMIPFNNKDGAVEAYFKSGVKSYYSEYKDGYNQGKTVYYHANGKEQDVRIYEKDQLHDKKVVYYASGKVKKEMEYANGTLHGTVKEYYSNGKLKSVQRYIWGDLYGWAEFFDEKGVSKEKRFYYNDRQLK